MADTTLMRHRVEDLVRDQLAKRHGSEFSAQFLPLRPGGKHEFDAVSRDGTVVVSVKSASGLTAGGRVPAGKIKDCIAELYYLSLVDAPIRALVLTTPAFHAIFMRIIRGAIAEGITIECMPLPADLQRQVDEVVRIASREVSPQAAREMVAGEVAIQADES